MSCKDGLTDRMKSYTSCMIDHSCTVKVMIEISRTYIMQSKKYAQVNFRVSEFVVHVLNFGLDQFCMERIEIK